MVTEWATQSEHLGVSLRRVEAALGIVQELVEAGHVPGAATAIVRRGKEVCLAAFGRRGPEGDAPQTEVDTVFLIASLTKPVVCAGAMLLVQEGKLCLDQPVASVVPEFSPQGEGEVLVRHLFTHTSGLPDQLPESPQLRASQAPKEKFVEAVCRCRLLFRPGTHISYQSMGILMLGEIVERITGQLLRDFLQERLFQPLGMNDSTLGMPASGMARTAISLPGDFPAGSPDVGSDWNTEYWRDFGAPWGGLHSTAGDLGRFLAHVLGDRAGPLSVAARRAMVRDQTSGMAAVPTAEAIARRWGLGFMLGAPYFGDLVSADTFGHVGATGTLYWADPETHLACVLLTNQPRQSWFLRQRYSNAVASSVIA